MLQGLNEDREYDAYWVVDDTRKKVSRNRKTRDFASKNRHLNDNFMVVLSTSSPYRSGHGKGVICEGRKVLRISWE
jgi:hypothetical protein